MKTELVVFSTFVAATCSAGVRDELARTKEESIRAWSGIRDAILTMGPSATNELARAAADDNLDWRERFMAGVCLERLVNGQTRDDFFQNPFRDDPEFDPNWIRTAAGYAFEEIPLLEKRLVETNLWYGVLEVFAIMQDGTFPHPAFKGVSEIVFQSAPSTIRKTAAQISEEFSRRFVDGIDEYASSFVGRLKPYILDGTHREGASTYLRYLASQKSCSYVELEGVVERTSDIALLESFIPRFSNRPPEVSMIRRRIDRLRESAVAEGESCFAFVPGSSPTERGDVSDPVDKGSAKPSSVPNDRTNCRFSWLFVGFSVLVVVLTIRIRFRRLFRGARGTQ